MKVEKNYKNQTYKNLQLLTRLFLLSLLIVIGLNYIFNNMIENLYGQTKILENKKNTEVAISSTLVNLQEDISDMSVVKSNSKNQLYFKEKIKEKIIKLADLIKKLEQIPFDQLSKEDQTFYQKTKQSIRNLKQYIMLFKLSLNNFNQKMNIDPKAYINEVIYI